MEKAPPPSTNPGRLTRIHKTAGRPSRPIGQAIDQGSASRAEPATATIGNSQHPHKALVWLRRDLRLHDNTALHEALQQSLRQAASLSGQPAQVWCVFVFDRDILDALPRADRRVEFIRESLVELHQQLQGLRPGAGLIVRHGRAVDEVPALAQLLQVQAVFINHDDEPAALARDQIVRECLASHAVALHDFKDHVVFERSELMTGSGTAYGVFTPYKNAWLKALQPQHLEGRGGDGGFKALAAVPEGVPAGVPSLGEIGFLPTNLSQLKLPTGETGAQTLLEEFLQRIDSYGQTRDFPALKGPSYLSTHLRFGTVSIRQLARLAHQRTSAGSSGAQVWLSELIWRDFYHQVLHHHPRVATRAFKPEYDRITWEQGAHAQALFKAWCEGRTGYPLVDAAMAQINQSGYMHNRLRMVVASFLTKDLGLDWRWGEGYFAQHLNDFDLAANNGGWQWAASTGCDAQPYFRIFNPITQSEKFDAEGRFIRRYLPQLKDLPNAALHAPWLARPLELAAAGVRLGDGADANYPRPIVAHDEARARTLARYAVVKAPGAKSFAAAADA